MTQKVKKPHGKLIWKILCGVCAFFLVFSLVGGPIANNYAAIINQVLGIENQVLVGESDEKPADIFVGDAENGKAQAEIAQAVVEDTVKNGAVLLKNDNGALPLDKASKVTLFGSTSAKFVYGGEGSAGMDTSSALNLKDALEEDGFSVNPTLWTFYTEGKGKEYRLKSAGGSLNNNIANNAEWFVNAAPLAAFSDTEWNSVRDYGDAAIVVIGRTSSEGRDLPFFGAGDADGNYLAISGEERELLGKLAELKAQGDVKRIVLLLNTTNAVELDVLNPAVCGVDYGIDACLWVGGVGLTGIKAVGDLLNGTVNPSGRLVDTYCYDNTTSPAVQNAHITAYKNASDFGLTYAGGNNLYYVVYQEGIYVGYRYYETRYEDIVLDNDQAGVFDYASTVAYPFGYGLSYSDISYDHLTMKEESDRFIFNVDVKNASDRDARDAVLIYMQSPYTAYDRQNGIEKAAVELVGFTKVSVPGNSTVKAEIQVNKSEMRTYDANGAKTYIVDAGNYYFATGNGAHDALNNILALKAAKNDTANGTVNMGKMTAPGNASLAAQFVQAKQDNETYAKAVTGNAVTNQMDFSDLNKVDNDKGNDVVYLTRADWEGTFPKAVLTPEAYEAAVQIAASDAIGKTLTTIPDSEKKGTMPALGKEGSLTLAHFIGIPRDGKVTLTDGSVHTWDDLLDQVKFSEMVKLIGQTYCGTSPVQTVNKPSTLEKDGPLGVTSRLTGGGSSTAYASEDVMAATFDVDMATRMGRAFGDDCLMAARKSISGIYGPGVNIHRTPYSGRNFEYYSEDPFISGKICAAEVSGIQSKGVYVVMKHFAFNDQETGRDGISVWTNEQAAREIYLQAFEYPIEDANAYCVMTGFNRIGAEWTGGNYNLLTNILRGEWGMKGFAITDFSNNNLYMDVVQGLLAGGDAWCCNDASRWSEKLKGYENDPQVVTAMRKATQNIMFAVANSNAMNGLTLNTTVVEVRGWWQDAFIYMDIGFGALTALFLGLSVLSGKKAKKKAAKAQ